LIPAMRAYFDRRVIELSVAGIARGRLVVDPGMGYFLGGNPEPSLWALKHLRELGELGLPLYVSTSRKSFIGAVVGGGPMDRGAGSLSTELWALHHGAAYVRTHDVGQLRRAWTMWRAIETVGAPPIPST